jgi:hypothetical protein
VGLLAGVIVGVSTASVAAGFAAYLATSLIGELLWAPVMPAMLATAYLARVGGSAPGAASS